MTDPILALLYDHWDSLRAGRLAPFRAEISPQAFSPALDHMFILETLAPDDIRFRLAGMRLCEMMGTEVRGKPAASIMASGARAQFARLLRQVTNGPSVVELHLGAMDMNNRASFGRMLLLPLRSDFGTIDRIIGAVTLNAVRYTAPLNFEINDANTTAITEGVVDSPALPGFAEAQSGFDMSGAGPHTVSDNPNATQGAPRGRFRVIKGGQD